MNEIIAKIFGTGVWAQFVRFGIVGLSNTLLSYAIYVGILWLCIKTSFLPDTDYLFAIFASFVIGVAWSFYWNRRFVFKKTGGTRGELWKSLFKTYCSYALTGLVLAEILQYVFVCYFAVSKWLSPILILLVTVPLNFILNKFWAFKG